MPPRRGSSRVGLVAAAMALLLCLLDTESTVLGGPPINAPVKAPASFRFRGSAKKPTPAWGPGTKAGNGEEVLCVRRCVRVALRVVAFCLVSSRDFWGVRGPHPVGTATTGSLHAHMPGAPHVFSAAPGPYPICFRFVKSTPPPPLH